MGSVSGGGTYRRQLIEVSFSYRCFSLSLPFPFFKNLKILKCYYKVLKISYFRKAHLPLSPINHAYHDHHAQQSGLSHLSGQPESLCLHLSLLSSQWMCYKSCVLNHRPQETLHHLCWAQTGHLWDVEWMLQGETVNT